MRKYIAYYRVSTKMQGLSGLGLEAQRSSVRQFVKVDIPAMLTPVPGDTDPLNKFGLKNPRD